jgi:SAM-dependent methyltransferase
MQPSSKKALVEFLSDRSFKTVLDAPSGGGWLSEALGTDATVDGIDLYVDNAPGYRKFWKHDLDEGLPEDCGGYDLISCCEGIEHVGSPLLLLRHFHRALKEDGSLIITTPNVWFPQSRMQYAFRGFFPSFPPLADKVTPGTHMHITPWTYTQLYVFLKLAGFNAPRLIEEPLSRAKHFHEPLLGLPAKWYCRRKLRRAKTDEEREFWTQAGSKQSLLSRHLMIEATKAAAAG